MVVPAIVTGKPSSSSQTNGSEAKPPYIMNTTSESCPGSAPYRPPPTSPVLRTVLCTVLLLLSLATVLLGWVAISSTAAISTLQQEVALLSPPSAPSLLLLQERVLRLEEALLLQEGRTLPRPGGDTLAPRAARRKRAPETLRRPSRYMQRPVPVYNKAYGINLKDGEGLQLYSTLQGPLDDSDQPQASTAPQAAERLRRPPPASLLKSGDGIRRRRPRVKSQRQRTPRPAGGLVRNRDVLYRESLYKDTPGDDVWDTAVSKVQQGSPAALSLPATPLPVTQRPRAPKRPNKKNSRRRRRGSRLTAAHFNGLPAGAGGSGTWEGAEWMEGLGLMSRYKTGGDHVLVAEPGIYLIYAQVRFAQGPSTGFDIRVNGREEASCSQTGAPQPGTCFAAVVTYLPKSSVVRVESSDPLSPVLRLEDGEKASLGLVKLLEAPETYHLLFTD